MRYYGITIGPISETLSLVARPAGLWYASYMFSDITRTLCKYLSENHKIRILAPYYEKDEPIDGVGSYFDKIFFVFDESDKDVSEQFVQAVIHRVKTEVGQRLSRDIQNGSDKTPDELFGVPSQKAIRFIQDHICIHYISITEEERGGRSVSEALSPYLDTLELYKNVQRYGGQNYLLTMFEGEDTDPNKYIKNSELVRCIRESDPKNFQLFRGQQDQIKNLAYISSSGKTKRRDSEEIPDTDGWKKWKYYAVVQADGDHLGNVGEALKCDMEDVLDIDLKVSQFCKEYTKRCVEVIGDYGGMSVYAGGDDLLFLAPVQNRKGETIFEQCQKISKIYGEKFKNVNAKLKEGKKTTLSVGISIYYWKFPLYEALENAKEQLLNYAKKTRNTLAVTLNKASGSGGDIQFQYHFNSVQERAFLEFLKNTNEKGEEDREHILQSILYHMKDHRSLFTLAIRNGKETLGICMDNMFEDAKKNVYFENSKKMMMDITENSCDPDDSYKSIIAILQLVRFFSEKGE